MGVELLGGVPGQLALGKQELDLVLVPDASVVGFQSAFALESLLACRAPVSLRGNDPVPSTLLVRQLPTTHPIRCADLRVELRLRGLLLFLASCVKQSILDSNLFQAEAIVFALDGFVYRGVGTATIVSQVFGFLAEQIRHAVGLRSIVHGSECESKCRFNDQVKRT